ncbi:hypothetical protein [Acaricomes phytoseiuli]|uniref:hypothetical protein n=1 Tax=Acaricomes phytoseiuli TaxID=291968 RepID=UPI00036379B4|nr:hypothetical protein [Acaricomes phytoseiuli]
MTDFKLPVIRHLTADEVEPGMTIAGKALPESETRVIGVADHRYRNVANAWVDKTGNAIGDPAYGYDLLAEAPKPDVELPQEAGAVIRYTDSDGGVQLAYRTAQEPRPWGMDGYTGEYSDIEILELGARDGYEVAHWRKPGQGPGIPKELHKKLRGMVLRGLLFRAVAGPARPFSDSVYPEHLILDVLRWAASQPVQDGEA